MTKSCTCRSVRTAPPAYWQEGRGRKGCMKKRNFQRQGRCCEIILRMWPAQLHREWIAPCVTAWITSRVPQKSDHTFNSNSFSTSLSLSPSLPVFASLLFSIPRLPYHRCKQWSKLKRLSTCVLHKITVQSDTCVHINTHTSVITMNNARATQSLFISMRSCDTYTHIAHTLPPPPPPPATQVADWSSRSNIPALLLSDISSAEVFSSSSRKIRWFTRF